MVFVVSPANGLKQVPEQDRLPEPLAVCRRQEFEVQVFHHRHPLAALGSADPQALPVELAASLEVSSAALSVVSLAV